MILRDDSSRLVEKAGMAEADINYKEYMEIN
jgi:hypothetical protein